MGHQKNELVTQINQILEEENAAYRIVGDEIIEISDEYEINSIESAMNVSFDATRKHIESSLQLISDKQNPDYRNAVKEAISAVEAAAKEMTGEHNATLGNCVKKMESSGTLHPAFKVVLMKLYGYTSDSGGIRHALTENDTPPTYSEAKFVLVLCSAFVNLLNAKESEMLR